MIPNLLIIAGTGNKSGKTSMACKIIMSFSELSFTAIKITPHFHESTEGLIIIAESNGFSIYEETNVNSSKDTSRMLSAGAGKVYFAKVQDDNLVNAFNTIMDRIPAYIPVICESPALRNFVEPGAFIIMDSDSIYNKKNIKQLQTLPHAMFKLEDLNSISSLPIEFNGGKWLMK
jgi:hypothetical protein